LRNNEKEDDKQQNYNDIVYINNTPNVDRFH
jgi:hypothetical protein